MTIRMETAAPDTLVDFAYQSIRRHIDNARGKIRRYMKPDEL